MTMMKERAWHQTCLHLHTGNGHIEADPTRECRV